MGIHDACPIHEEAYRICGCNESVVMKGEDMETPRTMLFRVEREVSNEIEVNISELRNNYGDTWRDYVNSPEFYDDDQEGYEDDIEEFVKQVLYEDGEDIDGVSRIGGLETDSTFYMRIRG